MYLCLAVQVSGSKFYYLKNEAVLLEMALINWTLSEVMKKGFTPLTTPEIARSSVVEKCGFQPRGKNTQVHRCSFLSFNAHFKLFGSLTRLEFSNLCSP